MDNKRVSKGATCDKAVKGARVLNIVRVEFVLLVILISFRKVAGGVTDGLVRGIRPFLQRHSNHY
jgi:hypothetical protein